MSESELFDWLVKRTENEAIIVNLDLCLRHRFRFTFGKIFCQGGLDICGQAIKGIWGMSWH